MQSDRYKVFFLKLSGLLFILFNAGCQNMEPYGETKDSDVCRPLSYDQIQKYGRGALLASRFNSFDEFESIVTIQWFEDGHLSEGPNQENNAVRLTYCYGDHTIVSELKSGIDQEDILQAKEGSLLEQFNVVYQVPNAIRQRKQLQQLYRLAKRLGDEFGFDDVAFYYVAEAAANKILEKGLSSRDKGEKGFINTFNHITAQALITTLFSEELADFVADVHELKNMPELTTGMFTESQLTDPNNYPVDNYIDMINNELGQEIGRQLKEKYQITRQTVWTTSLLANYLNDLQSYYSWAFQIDMTPFSKEEEIVVRFTDKMNTVLRPTEGAF